jgi:hypothetical protein
MVVTVICPTGKANRYKCEAVLCRKSAISVWSGLFFSVLDSAGREFPGTVFPCVLGVFGDLQGFLRRGAWFGAAPTPRFRSFRGRESAGVVDPGG